MTPARPFALHITWTCYATWLPGDARGYVSNTLLPGGGFEPKQNVPGTPCTADDACTRDDARRRQKWPTAYLTPELARVAAEGLVAAAAKRSWRILQAALMPNHVHVVITDCPDDGPAVRRVLKGGSQAALADHLGHSWRCWTAGGSDRYKHGWRAIETAVGYVARQPGRLVVTEDMQVRVVSEQTCEPPA